MESPKEARPREFGRPEMSYPVAEEVLRLALVAAVEAAAAGEPRHGALDAPAMTPKPLRGPDSLASDAVPDTPLG
jgi:hypothetical protein